MASYEELMEIGAGQYAGALSTLRDRGFLAEFTQTGGMCAALLVRLERGVLLVTDASEELPWRASSQRGWGVGFYRDDDVSEGPVAYVEDESDTSTARLLELVGECMRELTTAAGRT